MEYGDGQSGKPVWVKLVGMDSGETWDYVDQDAKNAYTVIWDTQEVIRYLYVNSTKSAVFR